MIITRGCGAREMDSFTDHSNGLIHPAFHARISRIATARQKHINQMTTAALSSLEAVIASLRRTAVPRGQFPEVEQIALAVQPALTLIGASLQRWNSGELPASAETDAVAACLLKVITQLKTAHELCTGGNVVPTPPIATSAELLRSRARWSP